MKRYTDTTGMYLAVDERHSATYIGWYDNGEGDYGLMLGERGGGADHAVASKALASYLKSAGLDPMSGDRAHVFDSARHAREALRAINAALLSWSASKPWPDWALNASEAGWKAPKGWAP